MSALIVNGQRWWDTARACAQLRVTPDRLRDWVRRSKAAGHTTPATSCARCAGGEGGFPHVDPPVRRGRLAGYDADQLLDAELHTAASTRGNRRQT
jgi:hypothetical protein